MFKVGEIVKYAPQYCGEGEQYYIHEVKEADRGRYLISTLNTMLTLGSTQRVTEDMIQKASKYEVITWHGKYIVTDTESKKFFAGYDPMGSVIWVDNQDEAEANELEYAEQYKADLESSDEPMAKDEPEADPMMEKLQIALDGAVLDRDDFYNQYERMIKEGKPSDMIHRMYLRYEHAQGYVEGLTNAIFIAGYGIQSAVDSSKLTLTK